MKEEEKTEEAIVCSTCNKELEPGQRPVPCGGCSEQFCSMDCLNDHRWDAH
ncbi:hypothetical protein ACFL6Y_09300 [Elusimicrobiota bacterium]